MADLDLRLLRYFAALAKHGTFTAAAENLGVTQPALSQAIRRLEDVVRTPLVERAPRGSPQSVTLSTAGARFLVDAEDLLQHADRIVKRTEANARIVALRIGFGTSTPYELSERLRRTSEGLGGVDLRFVYLAWGDEVAALERGDIDAAFVQTAGRFEHHLTTALPLGTVPRVAVFREDHRLAGRREVSMADLEGEPIVDAESDRDFWLVNPRPNGRPPSTVGPRARIVDEMLSFVSLGFGMAITSATVAAKHRHPGLCFLPVTDLEPATLFLLRLANDNRAELVRLFERFGSVGSSGEEKSQG